MSGVWARRGQIAGYSAEPSETMVEVRIADCAIHFRALGCMWGCTYRQCISASQGGSGSPNILVKEKRQVVTCDECC